MPPPDATAAAAGTSTATTVSCPDPGPAPRSDTALDPTAATYLGRDGADSANAVDITAGCEIVVGGRFTGLSGGTATTLGKGGAGAVLRLDPTGRKLLGTTRLAGVVEDLEVRLGDLCADSRVDRIAPGRDGRLYLAGETAGGNTIFNRSATDPSRPAPNLVIDSFTEASNTSNAHLAYLARFDPATGRQLAGQTLLARIDTKGDQGNTIGRCSPHEVSANPTRAGSGVSARGT
ncbi:hypothetical protein V6V47_29080 [Micromonospora sp. CPCC 205539]|uniref:hypothetical protein n=1 Tax=Micromonospora sp. CPCC 205539 TaxID=3122408 RepID=UPI002FF0928D